MMAANLPTGAYYPAHLAHTMQMANMFPQIDIMANNNTTPIAPQLSNAGQLTTLVPTNGNSIHTTTTTKLTRTDRLEVRMVDGVGGHDKEDGEGRKMGTVKWDDGNG